jgi:hypothetical protein
MSVIIAEKTIRLSRGAVDLVPPPVNAALALSGAEVVREGLFVPLTKLILAATVRPRKPASRPATTGFVPRRVYLASGKGKPLREEDPWV